LNNSYKHIRILEYHNIYILETKKKNTKKCDGKSLEKKISYMIAKVQLYPWLASIFSILHQNDWKKKTAVKDTRITGIWDPDLTLTTQS